MSFFVESDVASSISGFFSFGSSFLREFDVALSIIGFLSCGSSFMGVPYIACVPFSCLLRWWIENILFGVCC